MLEQLRRTFQVLEKPSTALMDSAGVWPLGIVSIDARLGGGLTRGALHEIAAVREAHLTAATGFALGLAARKPARIVWIAEDMTLAESGAPYGGGLGGFGLAPDHLITVAVTRQRDLLWAMEEALHCRAVDVVIGECRSGTIDAIAVRRLSLAAAETGAFAIMLRATPSNDASTAATRWVVGASPSARTPYGPGAPRFDTHLVRNRRGPLGSWTLEWSDHDEQFQFAHVEPLALPSSDRPHRQGSRRVA